jgi:hypothetical protein
MRSPKTESLKLSANFSATFKTATPQEARAQPGDTISVAVLHKGC